MGLNHSRIEMACATRCNLFHWKAKASKTVCIVFSLQIAGQNSAAAGLWQPRQSLSHQPGLPRSGRTDQVQTKNTVLLEPAPQIRCQSCILIQYFLTHFNSLHILPPRQMPGRVPRHQYTWFQNYDTVDTLTRNLEPQIHCRNRRSGVFSAQIPFPLSCLHSPFPEGSHRRQIEVPKYSLDRKSTRLNSSHIPLSRMPSSA